MTLRVKFYVLVVIKLFRLSIILAIFLSKNLLSCCRKKETELLLMEPGLKLIITLNTFAVSSNLAFNNRVPGCLEKATKKGL